MSLIGNGNRIICDGGCGSTERSLDILRTLVTDDGARPNGWLYVLSGNDRRHYCPKCTRAYLRMSMESGTKLQSYQAH